MTRPEHKQDLEIAAISSVHDQSVNVVERPRYYRPELDVLRFFAFLMVFASHSVPGDEAFYSQWGIPSGISRWIISMAASGAFGVDLFFALSSFLITTLLLREQQSFATINISSFYMRRVLRIWPLYFVFLLAFAPLLDHWLSEQAMPREYVVAFALLAGNWACVFWGYPHSVASPLWSVSIEEQFYLVWPFLMRRWAHQLVSVGVVLLLVSFITRIWLVIDGVGHPQIWCNTLARLDPIACGALLAARAHRSNIVIAPRVRALLVLLSFVSLAAIARYGDFVGVKALFTFPAVTLVSITLIVCALGWHLPESPSPISRALVYLGRISYGLYVFHLAFVYRFGVSSTHGPIARPVAMIGALAATIAMAAISYHFLEQPFLRLKLRFTRVASEPERWRLGGDEVTTSILG